MGLNLGAGINERVPRHELDHAHGLAPGRLDQPEGQARRVFDHAAISV